jgi:hypothetical protein
LPINTAEGGTNGTTVTLANSGGASGAPFDALVIGDATATLIYDNTHPASGSLSYKFQLGSVATEDYVSWTAQFSATNRKRAFFKFDGYWTGLPAAAIYQLRVANAAGTNTLGLKIDVAGKLAIFDGAGGLIATMASAVPLNTLFHVEIELSVTGTSGAVVVRRWDVAGGNYDTVSGTVTAAVPVGRIRWGHTGTGVMNVGPWWMDNLEVAFPDAAVTPPDTFLDNDLILDEDNSGSPLGTLYQPWPEQTVDTTVAVQTLAPVAIDGSDFPGQAVLAPGVATLAPAGVNASGLVGQSTLTTTLAPVGVDASSPVGQSVVTPAISPVSVPSTATVGQSSLTTSYTLAPAGVDASATPGQSTVGLALAPAAIGTGETAGNPVLTPGTVTVAPVGIASAETVGQTVVAALGAPLNPASIGATDAVGQTTLTTSYTLAPAGIGSSQTVGVASLGLTVAPAAIDGSTVAGQAQLSQAISPAGIPGSQAVGFSTLTPGVVTFNVGGIPTAEQVGQSVLTVAGLLVAPAGIPSAASVGNPTLAGALPTVGTSATSYPSGPGSASMAPAAVASALSTTGASGSLTAAPSGPASALANTPGPTSIGV